MSQCHIKLKYTLEVYDYIQKHNLKGMIKIIHPMYERILLVMQNGNCLHHNLSGYQYYSENWNTTQYFITDKILTDDKISKLKRLNIWLEE